MTVLLTTIGVAFVSALIPLVNLEAYLGGLALLNSSLSWWAVVWVSAAAAFGQMIGKVLFYLAGRGILTLPGWLRRRSAEEALVLGAPAAAPTKTAVRMARWRARLDARPWLAGALVALSAAAGIPPFAIVSVAAGAFRVPAPVFVVAGLLGRWARFAFVLALVVLAAD